RERPARLRETRQMPSPKMLVALAILLVAAMAGGAPKDEVRAEPDAVAGGDQEVARPFIEKHCMRCHGAAKAKAGFRIDLLGADFAKANVAEHWKEVLDRIQAGEMPPRGSPRPDAKQAAAFVNWVNAQLREVDRAARNAGGRIPMRRLNRDE